MMFVHFVSLDVMIVNYVVYLIENVFITLFLFVELFIFLIKDIIIYINNNNLFRETEINK